MANVASPRGLRLGGPLLGCHLYSVATTYATAMYLGDPVVQTGSGNQVVVATIASTNSMCGAIIGIYDSNKIPGTVDSSGIRLNYRAASTACYVLVADDPRQVFIAQTDSGTYGVADCGANASMASAAGSTVSGQSGWVIAAGTASSTGTTEQLRLIREVDRADNATGLANTDWYVFINYHQRAAGVVGAGV